MINPELKRNIWLELSPQRLLLMPGVLALIFLFAFLIDRETGSNFSGLSKTSNTIFFLLCFLWAAKCSAESLSDEITDHTWDFQRMSPIGAWKMTWGKLLGSCIFPWYGAAICLAAYVTAELQRNSEIIVFKTVLVMILSAVFCQVTAFIISMDAIVKSHAPGRGTTVGSLLIAFPLGSWLYAFSTFISRMQEQDIIWYGINFSSYTFFVVSLAVFLAWIVLGAYRLMRVELQYQSAPWAWFFFVLYQIVFLAGFIPSEVQALDLSILNIRLLTAFLVSLFWFYMMAASEPKLAVNTRKLMQAWRAKKTSAFLSLLPRWFVTLLIAFALALILLSTSSAQTLGEYRVSISAFTIAALLFALRDILIFLTLNFSSSTARRADSYAMIYLVILYGLLPGVAGAAGLRASWVMFYPYNFSQSLAASIIAPSLEVCLMAFIFHKKWKANIRAVEA